MARVTPTAVSGDAVYHEFTALDAVSATDHIAVQASQNWADWHTLALTATGAPTTATVQLEGSLDASTWFSMSGDQTITSPATTAMFHVVNKPVKFVRVNLSVLTGGTSPTVTAKYLGVVR